MTESNEPADVEAIKRYAVATDYAGSGDNRGRRRDEEDRASSFCAAAVLSGGSTWAVT